jgi:hypothetical protein
MRYQIVAQEKWDDLVKAYAAGSCTVLAGDVSLLAAARSNLKTPADHIILPELITKEPMGPAVRQDDPQWFAVVRWTLMALIEAEELGLTSLNVDAKRASTEPEIRRFLGLEANLGQALGLPRDWGYQVVKNVGNYGETFERTVGANTDLKLTRGLNNLWTKGGLMYDSLTVRRRCLGEIPAVRGRGKEILAQHAACRTSSCARLRSCCSCCFAATLKTPPRPAAGPKSSFAGASAQRLTAASDARDGSRKLRPLPGLGHAA